MNRSISAFKLLPLLIVLFTLINSKSYCQASITPVTDTAGLAWLKELYEPGVSLQADTLLINKEAERLLHDEMYRQTMYPAAYTWEGTAGFIQKQEIKKAVWYFINLYMLNEQNKELVIKSLLVYDKFFKMDKVLMSSFYTYSFTDPEIGTIKNGQSEITAPHIMEKKLNTIKEILFYLNKYRPADRKADTQKQ